MQTAPFTVLPGGLPVHHTLASTLAAEHTGQMAGTQVEQEAEALLRAHGRRVTRPRLVILTALLEAGEDHVSAEALLDQLASHHDVHRATIYRTLDGLAADGLLRHVHLDRGRTAYHLVEPPATAGRSGTSTAEVPEDLAHLHAQCGDCGAVVDLPSDVLGDAGDRIRKATGFRLDASHVALSGRCAACGDVER
jgi:Fur family ferric uptake transcriptional regulator